MVKLLAQIFLVSDFLSDKLLDGILKCQQLIGFLGANLQEVCSSWELEIIVNPIPLIKRFILVIL